MLEQKELEKEIKETKNRVKAMSSDKKDIDGLNRRHAMIGEYPIMLKAYNDGYVEAERVLEKLEEAVQREINPDFCPTCGHQID